MKKLRKPTKKKTQTVQGTRAAVSRFCSALAKMEKKKVSVSIGNVREVIRLANLRLGGKLYIDILEQSGE